MPILSKCEYHDDVEKRLAALRKIVREIKKDIPYGYHTLGGDNYWDEKQLVRVAEELMRAFKKEDHKSLLASNRQGGRPIGYTSEEVDAHIRCWVRQKEYDDFGDLHDIEGE